MEVIYDLLETVGFLREDRIFNGSQTSAMCGFVCLLIHVLLAFLTTLSFLGFLCCLYVDLALVFSPRM